MSLLRKKIGDIRRNHRREVAQHNENLRAYFGDEIANSRAGRRAAIGINISATLNSCAPLIAAVIMVCFVAVGSAFGQQVKPLDGDSGQLGRSIAAIIKWVAIGVLFLSVGSIFWTIVNGIRGEAWQGKLVWGIIGFCASGLTAWAFDIGQGKDPVFDTTSLGR